MPARPHTTGGSKIDDYRIFSISASGVYLRIGIFVPAFNRDLVFVSESLFLIFIKVDLLS